MSDSLDLTPGERLALENLAKKAQGEEVGWFNIADARTLVDKGLADRDRQGWRVNAAGSASLLQAPSAARDSVLEAPTQLHPRPPDDRVGNDR